MEDRSKGCFYGCIVGDALGAALEFQWRDEVPLVKDMIPSECHRTPAGAFTDDASMMMCLAASLVHTKGFQDPDITLQHYLEWFMNGYLSSTGECFDIGHTTRGALTDYMRSGTTMAQTFGKREAGNGSLMRIAPIPILFSEDYDTARCEGEDSSYTTHSNSVAVWCCGVFSHLCAMAIQGHSRSDLIRYIQSVKGPADHEEDVERIIKCEFLTKVRDDIVSSGYVVDTMEAALWAFFQTTTFEEGAILAVNLARDADTVGAVYGTLAGAFYGFSQIPDRWLSALLKPDMISGVWTDFWNLCSTKKSLKNLEDEPCCEKTS